MPESCLKNLKESSDKKMNVLLIIFESVSYEQLMRQFPHKYLT